MTVARCTAGPQAWPDRRMPSRSPSTASRPCGTLAPPSSDSSASTRAARSCDGRSSSTLPSISSRNATPGAASASRRTAISAWAASTRGLLRNLARAGVAKNRSSTSTWVPGGPAQGSAGYSRPPSTRRRHASAEATPFGREDRHSRAAAPMLGSASPRKPSVSTRTRVSSSSLEVQCRSTASARASALMPTPSSTTSIRVMPPPHSDTATRRARASRAFSTSSLTAAAGRSITSPAAIRLITRSDSRRITGGSGAKNSDSGNFGARKSGTEGSGMGGRLDREAGMAPRRGGGPDQPVREGIRTAIRRSRACSP